MNEQLGESLSALMDGEAGDQELRDVLDNVQNSSLRESWLRYHTARHGLQPGAVVGGVDLSGRIMAAIDQEPVYAAQPSPNDAATRIQPVSAWHRFLRPAASFAVAASVFAVVLVGSQFYLGQAGDGTIDQSAGVSPDGMVTTFGGSATRAGYATPSVPAVAAPPAPANYDAIAQQRLERYMLSHAEEASLNAPQGMMPYARVATFRTED
jgi:sigma-E factor negative regulatory protein RseA